MTGFINQLVIGNLIIQSHLVVAFFKKLNFRIRTNRSVCFQIVRVDRPSCGSRRNGQKICRFRHRRCSAGYWLGAALWHSSPKIFFETKFVKGVFCSSVIVATRYSSCVCGLHRELRTCGDFYAARLYSTTPARAAPAMTLMGLGFHLRRTKKPARKITRAIRSKLPKSAGRVRWP